MSDFNLEEVMANGGHCQTRNGRPVRIICTDFKSEFPVIAIVTLTDASESLERYRKDGVYYSDGIQSDLDLMSQPVRIKSESDNHEWQLQSAGVWESYYVCKKCGKGVRENHDDTTVVPKSGCSNGEESFHERLKKELNVLESK